jgi:hypothetical protein
MKKPKRDKICPEIKELVTELWNSELYELKEIIELEIILSEEAIRDGDEIRK